MHDQRSEVGEKAGGSLPEVDDVAGVVLGILVSSHPGLLGIEELVCEFAGLRDRGSARVLVEDGLAQLLASGLAHRLDGFVFASRAAMRAREWIS
jgi:hypothetical protein